MNVVTSNKMYLTRWRLSTNKSMGLYEISAKIMKHCDNVI